MSNSRKPRSLTAVPSTSEVAHASVMVPLENPEPAGELTVTEAAEIRARDELLAFYEAERVAAQTTIARLNKVMAVLVNEKASFVSNAVRRRGLDLNDEFRISAETGVILRVARSVEQEQRTTDPTPAETEAAQEAEDQRPEE
jgi:hypothetical protein